MRTPVHRASVTITRMVRRIRTFDVLAAISTLLLCLAFGGWANRMRMLVIDRPDIEVFVASEGANAELAIYGEDDIPQQKKAVRSVRVQSVSWGFATSPTRRVA